MDAAPTSNAHRADDAECAACGDPSAGHDSVAARYCAVSIAAGPASSDRGCLCRGLPRTGRTPLSTTDAFR